MKMKVDSFFTSDFYLDSLPSPEHQQQKQYHQEWPFREFSQQLGSDRWIRRARDTPEYASRRAKYDFHPVQDPGGHVLYPVNNSHHNYYYYGPLNRVEDYANNSNDYFSSKNYYNINNNLQQCPDGRLRYQPNMNYTREILSDENFLHEEESATEDDEEEEDVCWYAPPPQKDDRHTNSADEGFCSWNSSSERICDAFTAMDYQDPAKGHDPHGDVIMNRPDHRYVNNNELTVEKLVRDQDTLWHTSAWSAPRKSGTSRNNGSRTMVLDSDNWCDYLNSGTVRNSNDRLDSVGNGNDRLSQNRAQKVSPYPKSITDTYGRYDAPLSSETMAYNYAGRCSSKPKDVRSRSLYDTSNPFGYSLGLKSDSLDNVRDVFDSPPTGQFEDRVGGFRTSKMDHQGRHRSGKLDQAIEQLLHKKHVVESRTVRKHSRDVPDIVPKKTVIDPVHSETDVNMVGRSFNNFSISSNKQQEILRLLQERRRYLEANIREVLPKCYPETKILNTSSRLSAPSRGVIQKRHQRYRRSEVAAWDVAEGLVLERVRYDPNWKKRNRIFWTSEEESSADELGRAYHNSSNNCPKSVPNEIPRSGIVEIGRQSTTEHHLPTISSMTSSSSADSCTTAVSCCEGGAVVGDIQRPEGDTTSLKDQVDAQPPQRELRDDDATDINRNCPVEILEVVHGQEESHREATVASNHDHDDDNNKKPASKTVSELFGDFDVYNIETALPTIDWAKMEAHLTRAAREDDWVNMRKNDREEIRRRLALGSESEDYYYNNYLGQDGRMARKPSLSTRLQSGMNLQICFMNEATSDHDESSQFSGGTANNGDFSPVPPPSSSPTTASVSFSDDDKMARDGDSLSTSSSKSSDISNFNDCEDGSRSPNGSTRARKVAQRPSFFFAKQRSWRLRSKHKHNHVLDDDAKALKAAREVEDFYTRQARLQAEARLALAQAKEMAKMQMQLEKQKSKKSPIADIIGLDVPDNSYRISRQLLNNMNISQLQVIVNDLHTQIENLSEELVRLLMARDEFNMEQDSMLVDIEDLTRYLGASGSSDNVSSTQQQPNSNKISAK